MARKQRIPATAGSGNTFADLGFEQPEEELAKARLASLIEGTIKRRGLSQTRAAEIMGIDQPRPRPAKGSASTAPTSPAPCDSRIRRPKKSSP